MRPGFLLFAIAILLPLSRAGAATTPVFEKDIRPILKAHCFHCHGEDGETKGGLDLRLRRFLAHGGDSGPAFVPHKPGESHLLALLQSGEMPKGKSRLPEDQIALIETWIAQGAPTARPEPDTLGPEPLFTEEERSWWAFQPIAASAPSGSTAAHPIDAFLEKRLASAGLSFSPLAHPVALIRRTSFNLTGLPPTPQEVADFLSAYQREPEAAFSSLIDRLLASPAYGERWARHWLDVAGYADSDGYSEADPERKFAYRFRDYVIASFNADKPYDEFVREQLAGDEIAALEGLHADSPTELERHRHLTLLTATGFLRMAPDGTASQNTLAARNDCINDTLKIIGTAFYGMTLNCAQCHDHRYDPIPQVDYYRLRAVFEPGFNLKNWRPPAARLFPVQTKEEIAQAAAIEAQAKKVDAARLARQEGFITEVLEKELLNASEDQREPLRLAYRAAVKDRTPEQTALLKKFPKIDRLSAGSLYLYDSTYKTKHAATLKTMAEEAAAIRTTKPPVRYVQSFTELPLTPETIPLTHLLHRGDPESPRDAVPPSDLSILSSTPEAPIPGKNPSLPSTGRRLAYAEALTNGRHPLLARVLVNRVWMHHFGAGIVASAGDFGTLGDAPSHPELLDWLAAGFMENGWSLKRLHRLILTSHAWRQSSRRDPRREEIDPSNRLLSRQNVRRLEAETLRDALLAVSGEINTQFAGEPVPVSFNEDGQVVIGADTTDTAGRFTGKYVSLLGEEFRRGIYIQVRRSRPLEMFATFDAPAMTDPNCEIRPVTTVSPQSLLLMNSTVMREFAQHFSARLLAGRPSDPVAQIDLAWRLAYGRPPSPDEASAAQDYLLAQTAYYHAHPAKQERVLGPAEKKDAPPEFLALAALGHALLSANEFLYLD